MQAFMIAGAASGSGKTTLSIGLMRAFKDAGYNVAPFKVGPDYIDPMYHRTAAGNISNNLDAYMLDKDTIKSIFYKNKRESDIAIIEGVMGYYDGFGNTLKASSYDAARILGIPVILVVNAKGASLSLNALLSGFRNYKKDSNIVGVILNNVRTEEHFLTLKKMIEDELDLRCFGYLPALDDCEVKSRHLGLVQAFEIEKLDEKISALAGHIKNSVNLDEIFDAVTVDEIEISSMGTDLKINDKKMRIAFAYDEAFSFYYEENLSFLRENSIELIPFSLLRDKKLPEGVDGIYLGGGYPEVFAEGLSSNNEMLGDIKRKLEDNLPCFAECGGLMYLSKAIVTKDKMSYTMAGFFDCKIEMTERLQRFGYVEVEYEGVKTRAHEFHYSMIIEGDNKNYQYKYNVVKTNKNKEWECGLSRKNVIAGYPHIHFLSNMEFSKKIIELFKKVN